MLSTILAFIITIALLALCGWISALLITMGFVPLFVRGVYFLLGFYAFTFVKNEILYQILFFIINFIVAFIFFKSASKLIKNGTAITRTISDSKWSMVFFISGMSLSLLLILFKLIFVP
jgi:hypothetical protein